MASRTLLLFTDKGLTKRKGWLVYAKTDAGSRVRAAILMNFSDEEPK